MKLPDPILDAVKECCEHHLDWHRARLPDLYFTTYPEEKPHRKKWRRECEHDPCIDMIPTPVDQRGSGAEFLTFHRRMLRYFRWICQDKGKPEEAEPWTTTDPSDPSTAIPEGVRTKLANLLGGDAGYLRTAINRINELVKAPGTTLDELGSFIESTDRVTPADGYNLHNRLHAAIGAFEKESVGSDWDMAEAGKGHLNSLFYKLHGWIDTFYAAWQRAHNETVEDGPLKPRCETGHH